MTTVNTNTPSGVQAPDSQPISSAVPNVHFFDVCLQITVLSVCGHPSFLFQSVHVKLRRVTLSSDLWRMWPIHLEHLWQMGTLVALFHNCSLMVSGHQTIIVLLRQMLMMFLVLLDKKASLCLFTRYAKGVLPVATRMVSVLRTFVRNKSALC